MSRCPFNIEIRKLESRTICVGGDCLADGAEADQSPALTNSTAQSHLRPRVDTDRLLQSNLNNILTRRTHNPRCNSSPSVQDERLIHLHLLNWNQQFSTNRFFEKFHIQWNPLQRRRQ